MTILDRIKSDEFMDSIGFGLPANVIVDKLDRSRECMFFRIAYDSTAISPDILRPYVDDLLKSLKVGKRFKYDMTLALIVVALGLHEDDAFAKEYITDLAKLELAEMSLSRRVAKYVAI